MQYTMPWRHNNAICILLHGCIARVYSWATRTFAAEAENSPFCHQTIGSRDYCDENYDGDVMKPTIMNFDDHKSQISNRNLYSRWNVQIT